MNGPGGAGGIPWVDQLSRLVTTVGFPVVAAGLLLWFVLDRFAADVAVIAGQLNANATAVEQLVAIEEQELAELKRQTAHLERLANRQAPRSKPADPPPP